MKNCPYCAEKIQDAAVKCKFCGEWLEKKEGASDDKGSPFHKLTEEYPEEPLQVDYHLLTTENASSEISSNKIDNFESPSEFIYSPLAKKPKWGWGWFLLLGLIGSSFQKLDYYHTPILGMIMTFSPLFLLVFYFWYRKKLIEKNQFIVKIWHLSFKAGFVTYIFALVLVFLATFLGGIQEKKDNQIFLSQFQEKMTLLKNEEMKIDKTFIFSPETEEDININISSLDGYLKLINKKRKVHSEFVTYMKKYGNRKNDNQIINAVSRVKSDSSVLFQVSEESTISLLKHYKTGDEIWYSNYEKLVPEIEKAEKKYKISVENLMEKVEF